MKAIKGIIKIVKYFIIVCILAFLGAVIYTAVTKNTETDNGWSSYVN